MWTTLEVICEFAINGLCLWYFAPLLWRSLTNRTPVTHDDKFIYINCPLCHHRSQWGSKPIASLIAANDRKAFFTYCEKAIRCAHIVGEIAWPAATRSVPANELPGCKVKLTTAFMEHPYVLELFRRKGLLDAANAEARKDAGLTEEAPKS